MTSEINLLNFLFFLDFFFFSLFKLLPPPVKVNNIGIAAAAATVVV